MSRTEFILAVIFDLLMYRHDGWSKAFHFIGEVARPAMAFTPPDNHQPHPHALAIRSAMERRVRERRNGL